MGAAGRDHLSVASMRHDVHSVARATGNSGATPDLIYTTWQN